jgi:hypothetical protein
MHRNSFSRKSQNRWASKTAQSDIRCTSDARMLGKRGQRFVEALLTGIACSDRIVRTDSGRQVEYAATPNRIELITENRIDNSLAIAPSKERIPGQAHRVLKRRWRQSLRMTTQPKITRIASVLWILMGLFCLRVLGQVMVEFLHVRFLPPSEEWYSGLIPYPQLLAIQILIIALQAKIGLDFTRQAGWSYRPRRLASRLLLAFGTVYLAVMIIRYVVRMVLYPHERWTGGSIPIFFHWLLASYVLLIGYHHWRQSRPRT